MLYLAVAVGVVGGLCVLNLLLTVGVIRRLRRQANGPAFPFPMMEGLAIGDAVPAFTATTTTGETLSSLGGPTLVGFFSPSCGPCRDMLPKFIDRARQVSGEVMAVVVADAGEETADDVARLGDVATVVVEKPHGPVQSAFKVAGYPTVYVIDADGVVAGNDLEAPALAGA